MRRFSIEKEAVTGSAVSIRGDEARHIANVLRMQAGETIVVFDGSGYDYEVKLEMVSSLEVTGLITARNKNAAEPPLNAILVQGLAKGEKMDLIIQKAVELGVNRIIPIHSDYAVVKLDDRKAAARVERWNRVSIEACKQCGRSQPPLVETVSDLKTVLRRFEEYPRIFFYEQRRDERLGEIINRHRESMLDKGVVIFVGPEGGFSPEEAQAAEKLGALAAGLGPRTLRTETAGLAALSILMWELGDLGGK